MQVQIVYTCVLFFLFCFISLLFCNCIFLTKNKEITLELYFSSFYFALPRFLTVAQFLLLCFECCFCFYLLLPRRILVLPLTTPWMLLDFFCLFLIKDTVNYFLTFFYSCSWIVLLCEFVGVCCRRWPFYGKRKKCRWKTKRKNVKFKAKHSTISSPPHFFSSRSLVHLYLILRLSHSRLAKLFTKYFFFFFFVWSRSRSLSISHSTQTHIFLLCFLSLFTTTVATPTSY